jgi:hypothetical protein
MKLQDLKIMFDRLSVLLYQYTHALNQCVKPVRNKHHDHHNRNTLAFCSRNWDVGDADKRLSHAIPQT